MYERNVPAWRIDAKWLIGILLVLTLIVFVPLLTFAQLTDERRAEPLLEGILELTLMPPGSEGIVNAVREEAGYTPGEPLELLPGTGITVSSEEVATLGEEQAAQRVAANLSQGVIQEGVPATAERLEGSEFADPFRRAMEGIGRDLVTDALLAAMMPSGLDNGSRMANWPLQAARNPGEPVQPIVGVFVTLPPAQLRAMNERQIGERVVVELADTLLSDGLEAARQRVTNVNLVTRLSESASGEAQARLEELFTTLLVAGDGAIGERLEQARVALQAEAEGAEAPTLGVVSAAELATLDQQSANRLVIERLADRAYEGGSEAAAGAVEDEDLADRVLAVGSVIDALSEEAHRAYVRNSWLVGLLGALLLAALVALSRGWGRLANPGLALSLASAGGALLFLRLGQLAADPASAVLPTSVRAQGVIGYLGQLLSYAGANLSGGGLELLLRNHLALLVLGAALLMLSLLLRFLPSVTSRRRSYI